MATGLLTVGTAATAGMAKLVTNTAEAGDRVDKMSQKLGLSREGFQEWDFVMSQSGMSIDSLQGGMKTLVNSFDDFKDGGESATDAFNRLGLSLDDLEGKSQEEIFEMTVAGLQGVTDEAERAALANDLFGRSGSEMAPLLNTSADAIAEMKDQAHEMGMVMGDDAVDGAVKMTDTIDALQRAGAGLMRDLGTALMPVLQSVLDVIIDNMPLIQQMFTEIAPILAMAFEQLLPPLMDLAVSLLPPILDLIAQLLPFLGTLMETIIPVIIGLVETLLPPIMDIVDMILPLMLSLIEPLLPLLEPILELLQPMIDLLMLIIDPLVKILDLILPPLIEVIAYLVDTTLTNLGSSFSGVGDVIGSVVGGISDKFDTLKDAFRAIVNWIKKNFVQPWKKIFEFVGDFFEDVFDGLKGAFKRPINALIDGMNTFIRGLNKLKIPDWVPGVGGKGLSISYIPKLAKGLDYVPYDNFPALLHKGERVLTAEENKQRSAETVYNIYLNNIPTDDAGTRKLAQYIEQERRRGLKAKGVFV